MPARHKGGKISRPSARGKCGGWRAKRLRTGGAKTPQTAADGASTPVWGGVPRVGNERNTRVTYRRHVASVVCRAPGERHAVDAQHLHVVREPVISKVVFHPLGLGANEDLTPITTRALNTEVGCRPFAWRSCIRPKNGMAAATMRLAATIWQASAPGSRDGKQGIGAALFRS